MCGFAGFFDFSIPPGERPALVERMLSLIHHRGPDEVGLYFDDHIAFGLARLRIIDLVSGQQPFRDPSGRWWICFNGEIYNYRELREELRQRGHEFVSTSDTEVLLHAWMEWGDGCLPRLNGAFAF